MRSSSETFLVTYEVRPSETHADCARLRGAVANCWIVTSSLSAALDATRAYLVENDWVVVSLMDSELATEAKFGSDELFVQVQTDGLVIVFHTWPPDELDSN